ncbi:MAG: DUF692 domain-containing protein [Gammaproteobacteria bacterium]
MNSDRFIGFGLGLRIPHFEHVLKHKPSIDWFEVLAENFMVAGGKPKHYLHRIREYYPMVMHGVSMSIGSTDPLDMNYLKKLKVLANELQPEWISDHLCFTSYGAVNSHDLLPLPYNAEALRHVVERVGQVQDFLGRRILLENVSSYLTYTTSEMAEWEFLADIATTADCDILLDINNIYVSARNHGFSAHQYLQGIPASHVRQFHLAGHTDCGDYLIDTHDHAVVDPVWKLYVEALKLFGPVSTMIERDDNIPAFEELQDELDIARKLAMETIPGLMDSNARAG